MLCWLGGYDCGFRANNHTRLFSFILRNWNLTIGIDYFFRMRHSTTFQSYHISLSQIHKVRDGN
jgi:hypothetical protein